MEIHSGVGVSPGVAIGEVFRLETEERNVPERFVSAEELDGELERLETAIGAALGGLTDLREELGMETEISAIFSAHDMVLKDRKLRADLETVMRTRLVSAECAVAEVFDALVGRFEKLDEPYFAQRASDMRDIERRLLRSLLVDRWTELARLERPVVIAAHDLTPSQTAELGGETTLGLLTDVGGPTSHTAIIARSLGLPAVVGLGDITSRLADGTRVIVDGTGGQVIVDPDQGQLDRYTLQREGFARMQSELAKVRRYPSQTLDGHAVLLQGNIESPREVQAVLDAGGDGVGLFRTEFLFQAGKPPPTEEDHYEAYVAALNELQGRPLTIRTLDFGADKFTPDATHQHEPNPFLGSRSIRLCLERPRLFEPQLRAILRASAHGNVRMLFPMISSVDELLAAREVLEKCRVQLRTEGHYVDENLPVGVMVEIPSAALTADLLIDHADFFSIGSNDLVQYALAVDRINERVAHLYQPVHPAMLRLITQVVQVCASRGKPVSLCGEMAGDMLYTVLLLGMGLRELSLPPRFLPEIKKVVRSITVEQSREAAAWCSAASSTSEVQQRLRDVMAQVLPAVY